MNQQKNDDLSYVTYRMGLSYEPSLGDDRYQVCGKIGCRSQILTKDSVLKNYFENSFFCRWFLSYVTTLYGHRTGHHMTQWKK
jgi:hypothetical protein